MKVFQTSHHASNCDGLGAYSSEDDRSPVHYSRKGVWTPPQLEMIDLSMTNGKSMPNPSEVGLTAYGAS